MAEASLLINKEILVLDIEKLKIWVFWKENLIKTHTDICRKQGRDQVIVLQPSSLTKVFALGAWVKSQTLSF